MRQVLRWLCPALALLLTTLATGASAAYPEKPVRVIVPFPAGGTMDYVVRLLSQELTSEWGQRVVVENITGATGQIGTQAGAKAPPDGYTVLAVANSFASNPAFGKKLPYDTLRDFTPITRIGAVPLVLVAHPSVPADSVKRLVAILKSQPKKLAYGAALGGSPDLAMAWFQSASGTKIQRVPYRGQAPAQNDLLAGHIQLMFGNLSDVMPHITAGKMKALGIALGSRSPLARDIPTFAEAGYPGPEWDSWYGLVAPANTPTEVVEKISNGVTAVLSRSDVVQKLSGVGLMPSPSSPKEFENFVEDKISSYTKIIKEAGIKID